jgi:hypothetical protein
MTRDYAGKGRRTGKRKASASPRSGSAQSSPPWVWFLAGLLCGIFLAGLSWLAIQPPEPDRTVADSAADENDVARPEPRFDFYTLLPEQRIEIELEPESTAATPRNQNRDEYLLQAGSFQKPEDADRRRAELLLLGLEASVEEANGDNGRWFRVYIGPFATRSKLAQARSLTAQQGIDTLLLRRPPQPLD